MTDEVVFSKANGVGCCAGIMWELLGGRFKGVSIYIHEQARLCSTEANVGGGRPRKPSESLRLVAELFSLDLFISTSKEVTSGGKERKMNSVDDFS